MIYLDHNATTPLRSEVLEAMAPYLTGEFGNPSSVYRIGQRARKAVEDARLRMAEFIGADDPAEIVFTSGATEANNTAIKGTLAAGPPAARGIVTSAIEHSSVRSVIRHLFDEGRIEARIAAVRSDGVVDPSAVREEARDGTVLVAIMAVNNEIGTIQPVADIARIAAAVGAPFLVDAAQAAGKIEIDVNEWGADLLTLSAHKFGGPKGVGVLYVRKGTRLAALVHGGSHERNRRAGTENVAGIVGMAKAADVAAAELAEHAGRIGALRDRLERGLIAAIPRSFVNGRVDRRVPNTSNICFEYTDSSSLLMALDLRADIACSNGSACQTGSVEASPVLLAMGLPQEQAHASLRFSLGHETTPHDIDRAIPAIISTVNDLRQNHPLWKEAAVRP